MTVTEFGATLTLALTLSLPGTVGELEDDVISQVVHFPQPEVVGDVVAVHKRLERNTMIISWFTVMTVLSN